MTSTTNTTIHLSLFICQCSGYHPYSLLSTTGIHQGDTPNSSMAETIGGENGGIYRRLPSTGTFQRGSSPSRSIDGDNVPSPGVLNQHREIPPDSMPRIRVSGCQSPVTTSNTPPATTNDEGNKDRATQLLSKDASHQTITVREMAQFMTAISYLNRRGGTTSPSLCKLAKETWEWCMSQDIILKANHLPGHLNTVADRESRVSQDRWDWKLHPNIFQKINQTWGPCVVHLFASRLTH